MRIWTVILAMLTVCWGMAAIAEPVRLMGRIGTYDIEVELDYVLGQDHTLAGRYRYAGKTDWLDLVGDLFGQQAAALTESWQGTETGRFFLETDAKGFVGVWVAGDKDLRVELEFVAGSLGDLVVPQDKPPVNETLFGTYSTSFYWLNEMWAPNYEIGFNGGDVVVGEAPYGDLQIRFDFVVGPTYHIASFNGRAQQIGPQKYEHNQVMEYGEEPCHLIFDFSSGALQITQHSPSFHCGFGARAHAEFELAKISDEVPPPDER